MNKQKVFYRMEENKIIITDPSIIKCLPRLGYGAQGDVYKIFVDEKPYAIKIFNGAYIEDIKKYEEKLKLNIDSFVSPLKILYINDKFKGYLMKYCRGKDLEKRKLDITVLEFAKNAVRLMEDTNILTENGYIIYDAYLKNVMYDDGFKMIDIDRYHSKTDGFTDNEISSLNKIRLNKMLLDAFRKNAELLTYDEPIFNKLVQSCDNGEIYFEEFFNEICMNALINADCKITKINEIGKVLKKIQKI